MPPQRTPPGAADGLVAALDRAVEAAGTAVMGTVVVGPAGLALAVAPTGGHPLDRLLFLEAAPDWAAVGVAATGRAAPLGSPTGSAAVTVSLAVGRDGVVRARLRDRAHPAGPAPATSGPGERAPELDATTDVEGLMVDACRRVLGLATPAPMVPMAAVAHLVWLDALVHAAGSARRPRSWSDAVDLHPLADIDGPTRAALTAACHGGPAVVPARAAAVLHRRARAVGWARWRQHPTMGAEPGRPLSATQAAWFDDGMFSRWLPSLLPEPPELCGALQDCCPASLAGPVLALGAALDGTRSQR